MYATRPFLQRPQGCLDHTMAASSFSNPPCQPTAPHRRRPIVVAAKSGNDQPDMIERMFGKLFGQGALEDSTPFGMKRLTAEDQPEMYPAVTDEWAGPMDGDSPEVALLRPLLAKTQLERLPLRLAYDADIDGWTAEAFHAKVNTFGAGLLVARTAGGAVCGGYNPRGWIGLGEDRDAVAAFLFTWPDGDLTARPTKLQKVGGPSLAVVDKPAEGVAFGAEGLNCLAPRREREAKSRLGTFYAKMPGGGRSLFGIADDPKAAQLSSLKCYVAEGAGEAWELDGIVWQTKRAK